MSDHQPNEFEKAAREQQSAGFLREFFGFLKQNKKWWLLPIVIVFILLGLLILMGNTVLAPFIYTIF
jgi:hypothetical protein